MALDHAFDIYKNLLFYKNHQVDYFYFSSLASYRADNNDEYNRRADEIEGIARNALSTPPLFTETSEEQMPALQHLSEILDFLKLAVQYERNNEMMYFKQKYALLKDKFDPRELSQINEVLELEKLFSEGSESFDYDSFIALVNILSSDLKQTKVVAQYENERLEEISKQMDNIKRSRERQLNGLWRARNGLGRKDAIDVNDEKYIEFMDRAEKRFNRNIEVSYVSHGNLSSPLDSGRRHRVWGARKYLSSIPSTVDVVVGQWITQHINEIFTSPEYYEYFRQVAEQYVQSNSSEPKYLQEIREKLVKTVVDDGIKHTAEILQGAYKNLPADEFIDTLQESLEATREYSIKGYYSNFGQYGKQFDFFNKPALKSGLEVANELFDGYSNLVKEIKNNKNKKLTRDQTLLMNTIKSTGHMQTYTRIISLVDKLERKRAEYAKIQRQMQEGRRNKDITRILNLGTDTSGDEIKVKISITTDGIKVVDTDEAKAEGYYTSIKSAMNNSSLMKKLGNGRTKANDINSLIAGLKSKASRSLRNDLSFAITNAAIATNGKHTSSQLREAFEKALTNLKLSVGGPVTAELSQIAVADAVDNLSMHFPGKTNRRNDFITITLQFNGVSIKSTLEDLMHKQADELVSKLDPKLKSIQKQYIDDFETEFYRKMSKLKTTSPDFNSLKKNAELYFEYNQQQEQRLQQIEKLETESSRLWAEYVEDRKKKNKSESRLNEDREKVLNSLQDSFFVSQTMKTYNQYQNDLGFGGASLGPSVQQQLSNLDFLFQQVGIKISDSDLKWLQSAVINCSPASIFGEKNKSVIENYLSSLAAFAMFDEGGAEMQIIKDLKDKVTLREHSSPNILHLYRVNGIYIPGSVVLQRTIDELSKCLQYGTLAIQTTNRGAGVTIVNTMNEGMVPNRKGVITDTDPWGTVASQTDSHVKIKIMFLAGLLDIVKDMNKMMGQIELPE